MPEVPAFDEDAYFPTAIAYGSQGGPEFNTTVTVLASGHEQRLVNWEVTRRRYNVAFGVRTPEQLKELVDFFLARHGKATGFYFYDHLYETWIPCRFDTDHISTQFEQYQIGSAPDIPIVEIRRS